MEERQDEMNNMEFGYMLRNEREFIERLLRLGLSEEAEAEAKARLKVINETLGE